MFFWGLSVSAILIIENMVSATTAYVLWDNSSQTWFLSLVSTIVWIIIWYGIKWFQSNNSEDDYDNEGF